MMRSAQSGPASCSNSGLDGTRRTPWTNRCQKDASMPGPRSAPKPAGFYRSTGAESNVSVEPRQRGQSGQAGLGLLRRLGLLVLFQRFADALGLLALGRGLVSDNLKARQH